MPHRLRVLGQSVHEGLLLLLSTSYGVSQLPRSPPPQKRRGFRKRRKKNSADRRDVLPRRWLHREVGGGAQKVRGCAREVKLHERRRNRKEAPGATRTACSGRVRPREEEKGGGTWTPMEEEEEGAKVTACHADCHGGSVAVRLLHVVPGRRCGSAGCYHTRRWERARGGKS